MLYYNYFRAAISITTSTCCSTTNRSNIVLEFHLRVSTDTFVSCICEEMKTKGTSFPKTVFYVRTFTDCSNIYLFRNASWTDTSLTLRDIPIMLTRSCSLQFRQSNKKKEVLELFSKKDGKVRKGKGSGPRD